MSFGLTGQSAPDVDRGDSQAEGAAHITSIRQGATGQLGAVG
jgi:hypothetical protein